MGPSSERKRPGEVELKRPAPGLLEVGFKGYVNGAIIGRGDALVAEAFAVGKVKVIVFDAIGITGFDGTVRGPGLSLLQRVRKSGAVAVIAVTSTSVRMMATAIAFAAGLTMRVVATRGEADGFARDELARATEARP